ncbi:hypothetical protein BX600DRAFT_477800 [Xylariales sp. PMI_506]|nr:hypothetical protein BX600DRAFT_477800 [Xylariales sp. PMI_506]
MHKRSRDTGNLSRSIGTQILAISCMMAGWQPFRRLPGWYCRVHTTEFVSILIDQPEHDVDLATSREILLRIVDPRSSSQH